MGIINRILKTCSTIKDGRTLDKPVFKLVEEVGELATEVNVTLGNLPESKRGVDGILGESCDVIICALDIIHQDNKNVTEEEILQMLKQKSKKWQALYTDV